MSKPGEKVVDYPAGSLIVQENQLSRKMYIIHSGKVRVFKTHLQRKVTLAVLGIGEIFGELSFFDAAPRSASVETITDCKLLEIDGEEVTKQIENLPKWVVPLLKKVFERFRIADQKIAVLESINDFQKRNLKKDAIAQTIYLELLRFLKTMTLIYDRQSNAGFVDDKSLLKEMDEVVGQKNISINSFFKLLELNHIIQIKTPNTSKEVDMLAELKAPIEKPKEVLLDIVKEHFDSFYNYLNNEATSARYLMLSHSAVALLSKILGIISVPNSSEIKKPISISLKELKADNFPLLQDAINELVGLNILSQNEEQLTFDYELVCQHYTYQSMLKNFDHTIMQVD